MAVKNTQASLIFSRKHIEYKKNEKLWKRLKLAYSGGEKYILEALIRHLSELEIEFDERQERAYYFNYVRRVPTRITEFILAQPPTRTGANDDIVEDFDRFGNRINSSMRQWEIITLLYGRSWLLVDMPVIERDEDGNQIRKSLKDKKDEKLRPYGVVLEPLRVCDWSFGPDGELDWAIIQSEQIVATDPYTDPKNVITKTLWTRENFREFKQIEGETAIEEGEEIPHDLGRVPLIERLKIETTAMGAQHWMEDILRISDGILNNESECQINIVKQTFGLLVVPESFKEEQTDLKTKTGSDKVKKGETWAAAISRSLVVSEDESESGITRYVSPDGITTEAIERNNDRLKKELFDQIGLHIKAETSQRESAESKAWDNQAVSAYLQTESDSLEEAELKAWELFNLWDSSISVPKVSYNRDFNIQEFTEAMMAITEISTLNIGEKFEKRVMKTALTILDKIEKIDPKEKKEIMDEIEKQVLGSNILIGEDD